MKRIPAHILLFLHLLALTACGGGDEFVIKCDIRGLGTRGIEMVYYDRGICRLSFHPVDGKVELRASVQDPTFVEVYTIDNQPLFGCVVNNGDKLDVKMDLDNPSSLVIKGNEGSEHYAAFIAANDSLLRHGSAAQINALISSEVTSAPSSLGSTLLLMTLYRVPGMELQADSLLNTLSPEARPVRLTESFAALVGEQVGPDVRDNLKPFNLFKAIHHGKDTIIRYAPGRQSYSLLAFTSERLTDTLSRRLRSISEDLPVRRLLPLEISLASDSAKWRSLMPDTMSWISSWLPGSVSAPAIRNLAVPATPFYIVADSTGAQLYRGRSLYEADTLIRSRLRIYDARKSEMHDSIKQTQGHQQNVDPGYKVTDDAPAGNRIPLDDRRVRRIEDKKPVKLKQAPGTLQTRKKLPSGKRSLDRR